MFTVPGWGVAYRQWGGGGADTQRPWCRSGGGETRTLHSAPWVPEDKGPLPLCGLVRTDVGLWLGLWKKLLLSLQLHVG